ncbi:hypothetical protein [Calidifontibacillus erzurumensis]|uniref:Uncharacterized protein n=1 Tax=Calidifontibacillus erzurumensis TaxID=2741433 RepID=A0A8J8GGC7_9BACI|nr:hypothetical protein [Calidifontibacillus erzurumensis]NSL51815.1 hypothetical protein [Calidifontibacillus erzurumensis]
MRDDKWIGSLLIGLFAYTVIMISLFEKEPIIANQINNSAIIGLLLTILIKMNGGNR